MAIGTDSAIEFFGTQDTITGSGGTVVDGAFGTAATTWTNDDDVREATIILEVTYIVAADANSSVNLYVQLLDIQGTNDSQVPSATFQGVYLGSFPLDSSLTSAQFPPIDVRLPNTKSSQQYKFTIENKGGQTVSNTWNLYVGPKTIGPHA